MSPSPVSSAEISRSQSGTPASPLVLRGCSGAVLGSGAQRSIDSASDGVERAGSFALLSQSGTAVGSAAAGALSALSQSGTPVSVGAGGVASFALPCRAAEFCGSTAAAGDSVPRSLSQAGESPAGNSAPLGVSFDSASQEGSCSAPAGGVALRCVSRSQSGRLLSGCSGAAGSGAGGGSCAGASVPARSLSHDGSCSAPALED